jgi:hypothetical protein
MQKAGLGLGLVVKRDEFLDSGTQSGVAGTLLVQKSAAPLGVEVKRLLKEVFHRLGGRFGHGASVLHRLLRRAATLKPKRKSKRKMD